MVRRDFIRRIAAVASAPLVSDHLLEARSAAPPSIEALVERGIAIDKAVVELVEHTSRLNASVMIVGAQGVGKTLLARTIHAKAPWADAPFVEIDCGAPDALHQIRRAQGGTVVLDRVGDFPLEQQPTLLWLLQEGGIRDRVITASTEDLLPRVEQRLFSEELFYRLDIISIKLRPLCERGDAILPLAEFFAEQAAAAQKRRVPRLTPDAQIKIRWQHHWPGNLRELDRVMTRAVQRAVGEVITRADLNFYDDRW